MTSSFNGSFSNIVLNYWLSGKEIPEAGRYQIIENADLPAPRSVMLLELHGAGGLVSLLPEIAQRAGLHAHSEIDQTSLLTALQNASIQMNGADELFYLPIAEQTVLRHEVIPTTVRQLTSNDADAFQAFASSAPEEDLDEAFVELDHWLVFGCFVGDQLVSAASMYPWSGTKFADLGVLTLPEFRGNGYGKQTVRAMSKQALSLGYEPQYRCQPDNLSSVSLAKAAGFVRFASWDVVRLEENPPQ